MTSTQRRRSVTVFLLTSDRQITALRGEVGALDGDRLAESFGFAQDRRSRRSLAIPSEQVTSGLFSPGCTLSFAKLPGSNWTVDVPKGAWPFCWARLCFCKFLCNLCKKKLPQFYTVCR